ncbi:MAG: hypothetical protein CMJ94_10700 [Planctomycetes bacterium]|nr:hypothetical protein [Planctomycetota bacterium]
MRSLAWFLVISLFAACSATAPPADESKAWTDQVVGPAQVIAKYFEAVEQQDRAAALALGTAAWAEREGAWKQGFTHAFFEEGLGVASWELQGINLGEDGVLIARVHAVLTREGEEPDNEGMRFGLKEVDGGWKIVDLR